MNVNLRIPTTLNEITLGQYQEYAKLQDLSETDLQLKTIEIFCNVPEIVVRNMKATDIVEICGIINNMFDTKHQLISMFKMNGVEYGFIPSLEDMSFGEYVDLDTFIGDNDNLHRAVNVLYRPIEHRKGNRYTIKDYEPNNSEIAKDMPLDAVLRCGCFFLQFRQGLITSYAELFGQEERADLSGVSNFTTKWGWYNSIYGLSNGDITKFEHITKLGVHECLTYLTYTKEKNELEARQIKSKFK